MSCFLYITLPACSFVLSGLVAAASEIKGFWLPPRNQRTCGCCLSIRGLVAAASASEGLWLLP